MRKKDEDSVAEVAKTLFEAGVLLPDNWREMTIVCSVTGCSGDSLYVRDKSNKLIINFVKGRYGVPQWWISVSSPLTNGEKVASVCYDHFKQAQRFESEKKREEKISFRINEMMVYESFSGLDKEARKKALSEIPFQVVNTHVPLHKVFARLSVLIRAKNDPIATKVLERESDLVECCLEKCDKVRAIREMKALTLVWTKEGLRFALEYLLDEFEERRQTNDQEILDRIRYLRDEVMYRRYAQGQGVKPAYICRECANNLLDTFSHKGRWALFLPGNSRKLLYESAQKVVWRLTKREHSAEKNRREEREKCAQEKVERLISGS